MTDEATQTTCYRHPDRPAGVRCQRCDRLICPSCMTTASVGFHCPECTKTGQQKVYTSSSLWSGRPWVTQILIAVNVIVFVAEMAMGDSVSGRSSSGRDGLIWDGGLNGFFVAEGEWYRLITSGFLHGGLLHLGFNMYALWILGSNFERSLGPARFGLVYFSSLLAGALGVMILDPDALTVGASGAIYGLFGFALAAQMANRVSIWQSGLGMILLINLVFTFGAPNISIGGHLGGLVGGYLCGLAVYELPRRVPNLPFWAPMGVVAGIGVFSFVAAVAIA